jgi:pimeloyl-ACP methyl ester carboxylesterase
MTSFIHRNLHLAILIAMFLCCTASMSHAQDKNAKPVIETHRITAADGQSLQLLYYKWDKKPDTPVVLLLHMKGSDQLVWKNGFADELANRGYAVIALDFRKHGQSKGTTSGSTKDALDLNKQDYIDMATLDLEAVKTFIFDEHQKKNLNMAKMAIIAPEMSAPLAINYTVLDWEKTPYDDAPDPAYATPRGRDIKALVLISPLSSLPGIQTTVALRTLSEPYVNVAMLFCVGSKDASNFDATKKLFHLVNSTPNNKDKMYFKDYPYKFKGTDLFGKKQANLKIEEHIINFLEENVKSLSIPWQDRRSRAERN